MLDALNPKSAWKVLIELNLFQSNDNDPATIISQQWSTRIYMILMSSSIVIFVFYSSVVLRVQSVTYKNPSIQDFERLFRLYPNTLQCPCTHKSILFNDFFIEFNPKGYHPVCSSAFVSDAWIEFLVPDADPFIMEGRDFRNWGANIFVTIQRLCTMAQNTLLDSVSIFRSQTLVIDQILLREQFEQRINKEIDRFHSSLSILFLRRLEVVYAISHANAFISQHQFNWKFIPISGQIHDTNFYSAPAAYETRDGDGICSCATSQSCAMEASLYDFQLESFSFRVDQPIPGLYMSCSIVEAVFQSSLVCFYSASCIENLIYSINDVDFLIWGQWSSPSQSFEPLNSSQSRFVENETLSSAMQALFVESWAINSSYEMFFNACAPDECTFSYYYRFDALDIITSFLSIYGGLIAALQVLSPLLVQLFFGLRNHFRVAPVPTSTQSETVA